MGAKPKKNAKRAVVYLDGVTAKAVDKAVDHANAIRRRNYPSRRVMTRRDWIAGLVDQYERRELVPRDVCRKIVAHNVILAQQCVQASAESCGIKDAEIETRLEILTNKREGVDANLIIEVTSVNVERRIPISALELPLYVDVVEALGSEKQTLPDLDDLLKTPEYA